MKGLLLFAGFLAAWQAAVWLTGLPPFLLPGPAAVGRALLQGRAELAAALAYTGAEVALGLILGVLIGAALALAMEAFPRFGAALRPALMISQTIPVFALAPILTLWFGFGMAPKVAMVVLIVFFPVAQSLYDGLRTTPPGFTDVARTMGAGPGAMLWQVRLPAALPRLGSGLRLAAVYAPVGAAIGEWMGGARGLGAVMIHANGRMKTDQMFAALFVLVTGTVLLYGAMNLFARWLSRRAGEVTSEPG